jgi:hypothetical protein
MGRHLDSHLVGVTGDGLNQQALQWSAYGNTGLRRGLFGAVVPLLGHNGRDLIARGFINVFPATLASVFGCTGTTVDVVRFVTTLVGLPSGIGGTSAVNARPGRRFVFDQ